MACTITSIGRVSPRGESYVREAHPVVTLFCLLVPPAGRADVHIVNLGNNFFSPNDLTKKAGDTVRWVNNSTHLHDVAADDFSWASQQSESFVYERPFNTVAEVLYHCTVHSKGGRNIMRAARPSPCTARHPWKRS